MKLMIFSKYCRIEKQIILELLYKKCPELFDMVCVRDPDCDHFSIPTQGKISNLHIEILCRILKFRLDDIATEDGWYDFEKIYVLINDMPDKIIQARVALYKL